MDWKDALSAIRGDLDTPQEEEEVKEPIESSETLQKTPLHIVTDKKGRNGKIATIVEGFEIPQQKIEEIARDLKKKLGVGGSVRNGEILIQGDHKIAVKKFLQDLNFKIKGC